MNFHSLPRRELQALCKKNKIPANVTNAAMADSLKSLAILEGIDEVFQTYESELAQLSIEPRVRMEPASPLLPPTGGRSTRRTNPPKEETSKRPTRNANELQVDASETPVAPQTNRKKGQTVSACRDSLFMGCAAEEKEAVLTPAPWGVTNQAQGLRRSARLLEKSAKLLKKGHGKENLDFSKKGGLFTEDSHDLNLHGLDEISGVTDVSASTNTDECSAKKDEEQVDSAEKHDISTDLKTTVDVVTIREENHAKKIQAEVVPFEKQVVSTAKKDEQVHPAEEHIDTGVETVVDTVTLVSETPKKKNQSEVVQCQEQVVSTVDEVEQVPSYEGESDSETDDASVELKGSIGVNIEQIAFGPKIAAEVDDQNCAEVSKDANIVMALNLNNGAQETDGCDVIENSVTKIGGVPECEEADIECEDDFAFSESDDDVTSGKDSNSEEVTPFGVIEEELELNTDNPDDSLISEPVEESTKTNDSLAGIPSDLSLMTDDVIVEIDEKILVKNELLESPEIVEPVENDNTADQVLLGASSYLTDAPLSEEAPTQQLAGVENEAGHQLPPSSVTLDSSLVIPPVSTQIKKRVTAAASDNKENINSGSKTRRAKERSKFVKEIAETVRMGEQTMSQLSYDVEKLEITQKLNKKDGGNEVLARPALQVIQKNQ